MPFQVVETELLLEPYLAVEVFKPVAVQPSKVDVAVLRVALNEAPVPLALYVTV